MLHFILASILWWLCVCAPLVLGLSKFKEQEYLYAALLCVLALAMTPYSLGYIVWATGKLPTLEAVPSEYK